MRWKCARLLSGTSFQRALIVFMTAEFLLISHTPPPPKTLPPNVVNLKLGLQDTNGSKLGSTQGPKSVCVLMPGLWHWCDNPLQDSP